MSRNHVTRRNFVKTAAVASATVPYIFSSARAKAQDVNSRKTVASIGVGGSNGRYSRGGKIARDAAKLGRTIAVCDVDQTHNEEFNEGAGGGLDMFKDYRKLFEKVQPDVVTIGTPDHWHVPIAIAAMQAGADVYCEKPLTLTIEEGRKCIQVMKETGKVFQVGTQQRSECARRFLDAIAIVQLGLIGDDVTAELAIGSAPTGGPFTPTDAPEGLDWDMWLGPAPEQPYMVERRKIFRWFLEYSGGKMTDWGAHHIDIAQWALSPEAAPVAVSGEGKFPEGVWPENFDIDAFFDGKKSLPHSYNAPTEFHIDLTYGNGARIGVHNQYRAEDGTDFGNGILFTGSKGRFFVNRGKLTGSPIENLTDADKAKIDEKVLELYGGPVTNHMQNFFDCLDDRDRLPVSDLYSHHRTMTSCHLCNINLLLGRDLKWDPVEQAFLGDDEANALRARESRKGYAEEMAAVKV